MDVGLWLRGIGLDRYEATFRDNEIGGEDLAELTDNDLEKLGVPLGPRKRLLRAIQALRKFDDLSSQAGPQTAAPLPREPSDAAERRQLTVMFCDVVGSTALSARMDPEDLRDLIRDYHACVARTVSRFDGFVAKYMGDGVLVFFGYPQAHEDDAERAVRAALALIEAVGRLRNPEPLQVRIGIDTGLVVVGDLIGSGASQEHGVVGETPNLAARLQSIAAPNGVVIGPRTKRLLAYLFEYEDLGTIDVKGLAEPVHVHQVLRESTVESRFEALRSTATPLIGRDEEIALILLHWQQSKEGKGSVVLIKGEAGIGKSRLTQAVQDRLGNEP